MIFQVSVEVPVEYVITVEAPDEDAAKKAALAEFGDGETVHTGIVGGETVDGEEVEEAQATYAEHIAS